VDVINVKSSSAAAERESQSAAGRDHALDKLR